MLELFAAAAINVATSTWPVPSNFVCTEAHADLAAKPTLRALAEKAYGSLQYRDWSAQKPCAVPTKVLTYKSKTVLISTAEPPYQGHACQATLTAHVFVPDGQGLKLSHTIRDFAKTGENCLAGTFKPLTIAGNDAFAVEGSGGGQGARAEWLEFYRFDGGAIQQIKLPNLTCISVDFRNAGPVAADMDNIRSTWRVAGANHDRLLLNFRVSAARAKAKTLKTEWAFGPKGLTLVKGKTPEALADGACL